MAVSRPILKFSLFSNASYLSFTAFQTGMKLPGSRTDIIRTKTNPGPSPVGGGLGGLESKVMVTLDEFELQAVYYNMACAYAQLGQTEQAVEALQSAFENGFDNYGTVKQDPDLDPVKGTSSYEALMDKYDSKTKGFNPFGLFGGK
jgi:tetratricopeptide (TPR) repeat protein